MRIKLFTIALAAIIITGCQNTSHKISGKLESSNPGSYLLLDELQADAIVTVDSVQLDESGEFKFSRKSKHPMFYLLRASQTSFMTILIEKGEHLQILAHYDSLNNPVEVKGAEGTELLQSYNKELMKAVDNLSVLQDIYMENIDNPQLDSVITDLDARALSIIEEMKEYTKKYIDENPASLASLIALYQQVSPGVFVLHPVEDFDYFTKVDSVLFSLYPDSEPVKSFHSQLEEIRLSMDGQSAGEGLLSPGSIPPEIALPDVKGDTIKLSSTRGKVVLLDFWAAWCPPCRQESPLLVQAYDKYSSKGFDIFQVSLDRTREDWIKGIEDDKLGRWTHVSDVMYWNSVVVPIYRIESIPFNLLLDRDGRILDTNLRGERLLEVLEVVMNQ